MWLCLKLVWLLFFWFFIWASSESSLGHWVWHITILACRFRIHGMLPFEHASLEFMSISGYWEWHVTVWSCHFRIHVNFRVLGMACYRLGMPVQNPRQFQGIGNGMLPFGHASLKSMTISY